MKFETPYYDLVPKDYKANIKWRRDVLSMCHTDPLAAHEIWLMAARDVLFYVNTFVMTYDNRLVECSVVPFITFPRQDEAFAATIGAIGYEDLLFKKSRDVGMSWIIITSFEHCWHFHPTPLDFLMISRNEKYVDDTGNPKSLFWKIDHIHKYQPKWMMPKYERMKLKLANLDTGSKIDGESTTGEAARGDRRTAILLDEFAAFELTDGYAALDATQYATRSRIFNSTPQGIGNAFCDIANNPQIKQFTFHWTDDPRKVEGLYVDSGGKTRSAYYDEQCKRAAHPARVAQELDIDFLGSDYQFFESGVLQKIIDTTVRHPLMFGELHYDVHAPLSVPVEFEEHKDGRLKLWIYVDESGRPPSERRYAAGIDIAMGTGASNSVISIGDYTTAELVAQFAVPNMRPEEFARFCVALCSWFNNAFMIPESNGPGRSFMGALLDTGYRELYYKENEQSITRKKTLIPGWFATREGKLALLGEYRRALTTGEFINRSYDSIHECREYVFHSTGAVGHVKSVNTIDPSGARENHGDRPTADALLWKGLKSAGRVVLPPPPVIADPHSIYGRRLEAIRKKNMELTW